MVMNSDFKSIADVLKQKTILSQSFSDAEIEIFARYSKPQMHEENTKLMYEGEPATSLMFLISGEARVICKDHQLAIVSKGGLLGESLFSTEGIRTADVIASERTFVIVFTLKDYEELIQDFLNVGLKFKQFFESVYHRNKAHNDKFFHNDTNKYLALIAHNEMKPSLIAFVREHAKTVNRFPLVATGTTGTLIYQETGLVLSRKVKSGPLGGDQAIGQMISTDNIRGVLFFRDPLSSHPHHADIEALGRLCDVYQVPFATNSATARAVLNHLVECASKGLDTFDPFNPALEKYQQKQKSIVCAA
ncbi:MAG: methylglyoxal synthase [Cyanobacteria bacterium J06638_28]